jgi:hypothetical protein
VGIEPTGAEVVETVVGVGACFGVRLSWHGGKPTAVPGYRINCSLWGSTLQWTRYPACCSARPSWMGPGQLRKTQRCRLRNYLLGICGSARSVTLAEGCIEAAFDRPRYGSLD